MIFRAQNFIYNGKSKHIRCKQNTVRKLLSNGVISIDFVSSKDNLADPFTKDLSGERKLHIEGNNAKSLTIPSQLNGNPT